MTYPVSRETQRPNGLRAALLDALGAKVVSRLGEVIWPEAVNGPLSILIYHRILGKPDPLLPDEITVEDFRHDMQLLASRFNVFDLPEGLRRLKEGTLPPYAVCLTFDDGYRDNCTIALPVLQEFGIPATFFIATGYLDGGRMWNDTLLETVRHYADDVIDMEDWGIPRLEMRTLDDRRRAWKVLFKWMRRIGVRGRGEMLAHFQQRLKAPLPDDLMMTAGDVRSLAAAGMEIGCHTESHPILTRITDELVREEIVRSRTYLEGLANKRVRYFAYPNGVPGDDYAPRHVDIVKECGFEAAFSTEWGGARSSCDMFQLPRFTPWDKSAAGFALRLILSRRPTGYRKAA